MDVSEKKLPRKTPSQDVFDRRSLDGVKTLISAGSLTLLIFVSGVGIVWSTTTRTRVSDATAVIFSVKCFNSLKLYPLSGNIFRKWFALYFFLFIHEHLTIINNNNSKSCCCNYFFTDVRLTSLLAKNV